MRNYKFRLYPNKTVEAGLNKQLDLCRWTYNRLLEELNKSRDMGIKLKRYDTQKLSVNLKGENPELKNVYSKTLQMVNQQLWNNIHVLASLKKKDHKVGRLRFKSSESFKTINYNQSGFIIGNNKIILSKVGKIKAKFHREIKGKVKGIFISKRGDKWYACIQVDNPMQEKKQISVIPNTENKMVGLDMGINHFFVDSDNNFVSNPRFLNKTAEKTAYLHRALSRKNKESKRREKAKLRLNKAYEHLANQRKDFAHKLSAKYIKNYGVIAVEKLNIQGMVRNKRLAKSIYDACWYQFISFLSYKAESAGRALIKVNPKETTQNCSVCGKKSTEHIGLGDKVFVCSNCKIRLDRDYNASRNILIKTLAVREPASMLAENKPLQSVKGLQASPLKREAHAEALGSSNWQTT